MCQFQVCSKVIPLCLYMIFFRLFPLTGYYEILNIVLSNFLNRLSFHECQDINRSLQRISNKTFKYS